MGHSYSQLSLRERCEIGLLRREGLSKRAVAARLGRSTSTISRELERNSKLTKQWPGGYEPERAHTLAQRRRRWDARYKLARQPDLRAYVRDHLAMGRSPEQIAGRLALEQGRTIISHESIYRFVYHRSAQKDYWHRLLPRAKHRRGRLGRRGGSSVETFQRRTSIHERPEAAAGRRQAGHWEADLMLFSRYGDAVLAGHERASRLLLLHRQPSKAAEPVAERLIAWLSALPAPLRRTITFDNGTEFARHYRLIDRLAMGTFFCDTHSPWQKGGVENAIGRLRRPLPRKTDLRTLTQEQLNAHAAAYNNTPRKCLGFRTPAEVFLSFLQPLHFNRESTEPPTRE
jgi:IS30 family transposase